MSQVLGSWRDHAVTLRASQGPSASASLRCGMSAAVIRAALIPVLGCPIDCDSWRRVFLGAYLGRAGLWS
jgi:hypothetical protein